MKVKEFEKRLQQIADNSRIHVEKEEKDNFRVRSHDSKGIQLEPSYAGTVRVYIGEKLLFSLIPPQKDGVSCWYVDLDADITAIIANGLDVYISMLRAANEFMKEQFESDTNR
ncbi:hypothetical protein [Lactobacillus crispatus]|uniref:hypothetical protein n=1 Tax=Lactobacillus crispatus TaxID=47770 RepID=UPI00103994BB|nr:hypothetical protein [Lactobacillus crispatus]